jgi:hypothetical protein
MTLPQHEQRQLRQIEQALCRDDPRFGRLMRAIDPRVCYQRKLLRALAGVVTGAGLLAAGAAGHLLVLAPAGAVLVLLSLVWAVAGWRRYAASVRAAPGGARAGTAERARRQPGQARRPGTAERPGQRRHRRQHGNGQLPGMTPP